MNLYDELMWIIAEIISSASYEVEPPTIDFLMDRFNFYDKVLWMRFAAEQANKGEWRVVS